MKAITIRGTQLVIVLGFVLVTVESVWAADGSEGGDVASDEGDEAFLNASDGSVAPAPEADAAEPPDGETAPPSEDAGEEKWRGRIRDHKRQGFVNIMGGTGYFMVAPYDKDNPDKRCAAKEDDPTRGEPICSGRSGWHLDMLAGFGLKPGFELFAIFRLGLEQPSGNGLEHQPKVRQAGAGLKIYTPDDGLFKLAFGVAPLFDFSSRGNIDVRPDFVIHVPIAAHFDIFPWFGAYAQISPNISFIAEFRLEFTGGIGVQGRFP